MTSRMMFISRVSSTPSRTIISLTTVPFSPRIELTDSLRDMLYVGVSSICITLSPGIIPAFSAGVPFNGEITVNISSRRPISIPTPTKVPRTSSSNILDSAGSKKIE